MTVCENVRRVAVRRGLDRTVSKRGLPDATVVDNGLQVGCRALPPKDRPPAGFLWGEERHVPRSPSVQGTRTFELRSARLDGATQETPRAGGGVFQEMSSGQRLGAIRKAV